MQNLGSMLDAIAEQEIAAGRPLLPIVVIQEMGNKHGGGGVFTPAEFPPAEVTFCSFCRAPCPADTPSRVAGEGNFGSNKEDERRSHAGLLGLASRWAAAVKAMRSMMS